jgi:ATP-dependent protease ClpP protease subunit
VDTVKESGCIIETLARGKCMSAGVLIVAAGDVGYRYAYKNCQFMIHAGSAELDGPWHQLKADMKWGENLNKIWLEMMAENTLMPKAYWEKVLNTNKDTYFSSEQALRWGIIDYVL